MDSGRAQRLVEARLGRAPQDALEAAVVLEAWAGVPAQQALETARALMPRAYAPPAASATRPATLRRPPGMLAEGAALLVTVIAIALWAEPLAAALGAGVVERALAIALPLTLALQWALRARHLGRPSGLAGLTRRRAVLAFAAAGIVGSFSAALGPAGALAGVLTVTWTSGSILLRRGWAAAYAAVVAGAAPAMLAGAPARHVVVAVAAITTCAAALALRPPSGGRRPGEAGGAEHGAGAARGAETGASDGGPEHGARGARMDAARTGDRGAGAARNAVVPGRWSRTVGAGLTGAGFGVLLVGDPTVSWTSGTVPALALLPSAAGGLWAGHYLWRLADAFPRALSGTPACGGVRVSARQPVRALFGAAGRLIALTGAGSAALLLLTPWLGAGTSHVGVLVGFGVVALAGLLVALLESLGRPAWAALGVGCGVAGELAVRLTATGFPGAALVAGGTVALALMLPAALVLFARPARTLATALWIT